MNITEANLFGTQGRALGCHEGHLWLVSMPSEGGNWREFESILSPDEKEKASTFVVSKPAYAYAKNRALLRSLLSQYLAVDKKEISFIYGLEGKPFVASMHQSDVCFNVSHTDGLMVLALVRGSNVGVDCERLDRSAHYLEIAKREFSPDEYLWLSTANEASVPKIFWRLWVAKEACLKWGGQGLTLGLDAFQFIPSPQGDLKCHLKPKVESRASGGALVSDEVHEGVWSEQFVELNLLPEAYCIALAVSSSVNEILYQKVDEKNVFKA